MKLVRREREILALSVDRSHGEDSLAAAQREARLLNIPGLRDGETPEQFYARIASRRMHGLRGRK